ncbi:MAG: response regulator transcription factor [Polyangiaceae bacterium]|nr:response regulator transcription factor [Polyangiaceae bacterium]
MTSTDAPRLRALIVEDEWVARNYLAELLEASRLAETAGAVASAEEARELMSSSMGPAIDVVLIDVNLSGDETGGLQLARELAALDTRPLLVLATAYPEHAIEAYELGVADYLLKPFTEERVEQCLRRLCERRPAEVPAGPRRIVARRDKSLVFFELGEVWAFEAADRLTSVHTPHGTFDLDLSLAAIEASFGRGLVRVHRNWLVNGSHIKQLGREGAETRIFVGEGLPPGGRGVRVPVARERAQQIRELLLENATGLRR